MDIREKLRQRRYSERPILAYRRRQYGVYPDPAAQAIYDHHMHVMGEAKHYFFLLYGSHEFLVEVLGLLMEVEDPDLKNVIAALQAYQDGDPTGLDQIDPKLAILVLEPEKKRSEAFIACKTNLMMSVICSLRCFRRLETGRVREAAWEYGQSAYYLGGCIGIGTVLFGDESLGAVGRRGAQQRLKNDPRQRDKQAVRECWELWRSHPNRYRSKAAFARDMLTKFENLKSQPVIESWCREWESEVSRQSTQSAA